MPQDPDLNFYYILRTNAETGDWTVCRVGGPEMLSPQWDVLFSSKRSSLGSGNDAEEEVEKSLRARGVVNVKEIGSSEASRMDAHVHSEADAAPTEPAQAQARWDLSTEMGVDTSFHPQPRDCPRL